MYDRCSGLEIERVINLGWVTISDYEILGGNCEIVEDQIRFELTNTNLLLHREGDQVNLTENYRLSALRPYYKQFQSPIFGEDSPES